MHSCPAPQASACWLAHGFCAARCARPLPSARACSKARTPSAPSARHLLCPPSAPSIPSQSHPRIRAPPRETIPARRPLSADFFYSRPLLQVLLAAPPTPFAVVPRLWCRSSQAHTDQSWPVTTAAIMAEDPTAHVHDTSAHQEMMRRCIMRHARTGGHGRALPLAHQGGGVG